MSGTASVDIEALEKLAKAVPERFRNWRQGQMQDLKRTHVVDFGKPPKAPFIHIHEGAAPSADGSFAGLEASGVVASDFGDNEKFSAFIAAANPQAILTLSARNRKLEEALKALVEAKALEGVRALVAGWNGEGKPDGPYDKHPQRLGATLPKTNCGAVYELDEALTKARNLTTPEQS